MVQGLGGTDLEGGTLRKLEEKGSHHAIPLFLIFLSISYSTATLLELSVQSLNAVPSAWNTHHYGSPASGSLSSLDYQSVLQEESL